MGGNNRIKDQAEQKSPAGLIDKAVSPTAMPADAIIDGTPRKPGKDSEVMAQVIGPGDVDGDPGHPIDKGNGTVVAQGDFKPVQSLSNGKIFVTPEVRGMPYTQPPEVQGIPYTEPPAVKAPKPGQ